MNIIKYPAKSDWNSIVERPHMDLSKLNATVASVLEDIKENGDEAIKKYEEKFDHAKLSTLKVTEEEIDEAFESISVDLKDSLEQAHHNIAVFHEAQQFGEGQHIETCKGVTCWQKSIAIEKVGLYIPGGITALFHCPHARHASQDCRMQRNRALHTSKQGRQSEPSNSCSRKDSRCQQNL